MSQKRQLLLDTGLSAPTLMGLISLIKPQQTMFNYTSNWESKVILDITCNRVLILVLFTVLDAKLLIAVV